MHPAVPDFGNKVVIGHWTCSFRLVVRQRLVCLMQLDCKSNIIVRSLRDRSGIRTHDPSIESPTLYHSAIPEEMEEEDEDDANGLEDEAVKACCRAWRVVLDAGFLTVIVLHD
nr:hypothetical protein BaRGS_030239 [Batillaria attramentaria]